MTFGKNLYRRINDADVFGLSAQLAYFFLLSLFPFLLFLITLLGYLPLDVVSFMDFIETYAPAEITDFLSTNITHLVNNQNTGLLSVGIIGTLWSASNGVNSITKAFNRAYAVQENRSFSFSRLIAIALTIAMIIVIGIALLLSVFFNTFDIYIFSFFD